MGSRTIPASSGATLGGAGVDPATLGEKAKSLTAASLIDAIITHQINKVSNCTKNPSKAHSI